MKNPTISDRVFVTLNRQTQSMKPKLQLLAESIALDLLEKNNAFVKGKEEIWKDIIGYAGKYLISSYGRVKSFKFKSPRFLIQHPTGSGYPFVALSNHCFVSYIMTHRLVAIYFIPNPQNKREVNHKDLNKFNNHISNLEWVTPHENLIHSHKNGRNHYRRPIKQIDLNTGEVVKIYESLLATKRDFPNYSAIFFVCNKNYPNKSAYGYKWEYV